MFGFSILDSIALAVFAGAWAVYALVLDRTQYGRRGLNRV